MNPSVILTCILIYFTILFIVSYFTSRNDSNEAFFLGNRNSPWYIVAYGMIGTTLSGITFISVPGWVESSQFSYMQMVFGFFFGYQVIARLLLPLYYKLGLTSIYTYLEDRFGKFSYKSGSVCFLISRTIGASFRLYLIASVLQFAIFDSWNFPFFLTVIITLSLIWIYTYRSGIKTIIWTDTLQTTFMLATVLIIAISVSRSLGLNFSQVIDTIQNSSYSKVFFFDDFGDQKHFLKQFLSGVFMAIVMTGLDQDQMQKNLSCKNLGEAKKNMFVFSTILIVVDLLFLSLGALLYIYSSEIGLAIPSDADMLFPNIALNSGLPEYVGILFIIGIIAAAYSSADSALTSLTTSFCVDIIDFKKYNSEKQIFIRKYSHLLLSLVLLGVILLFRSINDQSVIKSLFTVAGYTYGPLLGLYSFGMFTKINIRDKLVPLICIVSPVICYFIKMRFSSIGFELLIINGLITFLLLLICRKN